MDGIAITGKQPRWAMDLREHWQNKTPLVGLGVPARSVQKSHCFLNRYPSSSTQVGSAQTLEEYAWTEFVHVDVHR
jgi:hypothetical protein